MNMLRGSILVLPIVIVPALLAGCPDGAGTGLRGQDGGAEAGDAAVGDADIDADGEGGATEGGARSASSALCGANGRDDCGAFLLCSKELGCVECERDDDCPAAAAHCLQGTCVGCRPGRSPVDGGTPDCPGTASTCWASDDECHSACGEGRACPAGTACDKASGECVGCQTDADCPVGVCSPTLRKCTGCLSDATCPAARPRCRVLTGTCEACTSSADCGHAAPVCDPVTFMCRVGCSTDAQCPGQRCDGASARCVDVPATASDAGDAGSASDAH